MDKQLNLLESFQEHLNGHHFGQSVGPSQNPHEEFRSHRMSSFADLEMETTCSSFSQQTHKKYIDDIEEDTLDGCWPGNHQSIPASEESSWAQEFRLPRISQKQNHCFPYKTLMIREPYLSNEVNFRGSWEPASIMQPIQHGEQDATQKSYSTSCTNIEDAVQEIYDLHLHTSSTSNWSWKHPKQPYSAACATPSDDSILRLKMLLRHFSF
ncbi:hypothetical protein DSO57_1007044 [Entomophthora muscae]|uniref:Uncharacterized protein n=1 Tax=Entomophthora muscae TaxID=34485 RepID=A0ACC2S9I7_9FUNG|nr:hypothetical protein DSO57_1007044 [Entomophthora muscae]